MLLFKLIQFCVSFTQCPFFYVNKKIQRKFWIVIGGAGVGLNFKYYYFTSSVWVLRLNQNTKRNLYSYDRVILDLKCRIKIQNLKYKRKSPFDHPYWDQISISLLY